MNLVLTCPLGLESLAKKEIEILGYQIEEVQDKQIRIQYSQEALINLNLWSRIGNKVYIELAKKENIGSFDELFNLIWGIPWEKYIKENTYIITHATSKDSTLTSTPAIQGITKKSIIKNLVGEDIWRENPEYPLHIEVVLLKNSCQILLDTSGDTLSKRWYRPESGEAPLRENIAAGIVLLSGWKFREPFLDPFCGSGTLCIEAALIARNIAPGLERSFAFEEFGWIDQTLVAELREKALSKQYTNQFMITWTDIDEEVLEKAKRNALRAWVSDIVQFEKKSFEEWDNFTGSIVTNPPYGLRLENSDVPTLYKNIDILFKRQEVGGGVITTFDFQSVSKNNWKLRKLYNGGEKCNFYKKVS
jgi:putative N6-adenine-specific DNA methylase